ncbi:nucleotidyltransferase family protein [Parashewanella tropica]|uniref:nucleotidyltransferase family protein n=1 Tax=Parashewanella tropica TaxID=2547970 RepID=UPI001059DDD3|nr:nucleotidyltransferase family protein [Parashewanella tropica]
MVEHHHKIVEWIQNDPVRIQALKIVEFVFNQEGIKEYLLAAGFVRNLVWDRLHDFEQLSPLFDIDVIFYDTHEPSELRDQNLETLLKNELSLPWSVKNQARMHVRNGDRPYQSVNDAMSYWPEKETAIGVRLEKNEIVVQSAFGLDSLFALEVTHNPKRSLDIFYQRVKDKNWLSLYPKLKQITSK